MPPISSHLPLQCLDSDHATGLLLPFPYPLSSVEHCKKLFHHTGHVCWVVSGGGIGIVKRQPPFNYLVDYEGTSPSTMGNEHSYTCGGCLFGKLLRSCDHVPHVVSSADPPVPFVTWQRHGSCAAVDALAIGTKSCVAGSGCRPSIGKNSGGATKIQGCWRGRQARAPADIFST